MNSAPFRADIQNLPKNAEQIKLLVTDVKEAIKNIAISRLFLQCVASV